MIPGKTRRSRPRVHGPADGGRADPDRPAAETSRPRFASAANRLSNVPLALLHLTPFAALLTGVDGTALALCGTCYLVQMFGITAGYHRYFSHRAYKTGRVFQFVLAWLGCTACQKGPLWWAAHHRLHHRHTDTPADPHSPVAGGVWWAHVGWLLRPECEPTRWSAVRDWVRYPELRWLGRCYVVPPLVSAGVCYAVGGWAGLVWGAGVSTLLSLHAAFLVNSVCHLWGRRRYPTADASRNNLFVAVLTLGEGWHNNHHHCQGSARQGFRWWEVDATYYMIRLLNGVGVVWGVRQPSRSDVQGVP